MRRGLTVIDVGCFDHPWHHGQKQNSTAQLIDRFRPRTLIGYDPLIWVGMTLRFQQKRTNVELHPAAVWDRSGSVGWQTMADRLTSCVREAASLDVPCVDIAEVVRRNPGAVLKIDAEGGEYRLLRRLHATGVDRAVSLLLIEWHGAPAPDLVDCPVEEWA